MKATFSNCYEQGRNKREGNTRLGTNLTSNYGTYNICRGWVLKKFANTFLLLCEQHLFQHARALDCHRCLRRFVVPKYAKKLAAEINSWQESWRPITVLLSKLRPISRHIAPRLNKTTTFSRCMFCWETCCSCWNASCHVAKQWKQILYQTKTPRICEERLTVVFHIMFLWTSVNPSK